MSARHPVGRVRAPRTKEIRHCNVILARQNVYVTQLYNIVLCFARGLLYAHTHTRAYTYTIAARSRRRCRRRRRHRRRKYVTGPPGRERVVHNVVII